MVHQWGPIWDFSIFVGLRWDKPGEKLAPRLQAPDSPRERLQHWLSPPAEASGAISTSQSPRVSPWLIVPRDCTVACPRARSDWGQWHKSPSNFWGLRLHRWCYRRCAKWQNQLDVVATLEYFSPVAWAFGLYFSNWDDHSLQILRMQSLVNSGKFNISWISQLTLFFQ